MLIAAQNILSVIPQRHPFVMIDSLLNVDETGTYTDFLIAADNVLVSDGLFSEAGLMENIAQTAAAGAGYCAQKNGGAVPTGYIGAVKNLVVIKLPLAGEVINTHVKIINNVFDVTIITGEIACNDILIASCEMKIFTKQ